MSAPYRIRPAETWIRARDDYLGGMSAEAVCRRHDLGLSAFRSRARRHRWRRQDQDAPPDAADLSIYDDLGPDEEVTAARRRYLHALEQGRSVEAARWRRLWHELRAEVARLDAEMFPGMSPGQIAGLLAAGIDEEEAQQAQEEGDLSPPPPASAAPPSAASEPNVHDVHPVFSGAHFMDTA